jgi:hypothetical protein
MNAILASILGAAMVGVLGYMECSELPQLRAPVRVKVGRHYIDTGKDGAHSGPRVIDLDGDGNKDLVVGALNGRFGVYQNIGTNKERSFESRGYMKADGKDIVLHNW